MQDVPRVPHHRTGSKAALCLKYQLRNAPPCREGADCKYAHIRPGALTPEDKNAISAFLNKAFTGGSSH